MSSLKISDPGMLVITQVTGKDGERTYVITEAPEWIEVDIILIGQVNHESPYARVANNTLVVITDERTVMYRFELELVRLNTPYVPARKIYDSLVSEKIEA